MPPQDMCSTACSGGILFSPCSVVLVPGAAARVVMALSSFSRDIKSTIISMPMTSKRTLVFPSGTSHGHALPFSTALVTSARGVHLVASSLTQPKRSSFGLSCFYQLRKIRQVRRVAGQDITQQLVSAFVLSRLDYCNSLLSSPPRLTIQPLQRVMNAAARAVMALSTHDHVKPALKQLHWLPVEQRISYKLCLLMHYIHTGQAPQYLSNCVSMISSSGNK